MKDAVFLGKTMKHKDLVDFYFSHPLEIEKGFRTAFKEFGIGHGRVDIVGVDKNRNLCVVEIKTRAASLKDELQVRHYRSCFINLFKMLGIDRAVRAIVVTPHQTKDLGKTKVFHRPAIPRTMPNDIPMSRQIFGLKPQNNSISSSFLINTAQTLEQTRTHESAKLDLNRNLLYTLQSLEDIENHQH